MRVRKLEASEWQQLRELRLEALADSPQAFRSELERLGFILTGERREGAGSFELRLERDL